MTIPQGPNQRWSMDFLPGALADGRRFRILAIVDARAAGRARTRDGSTMIGSDNGTEQITPGLYPYRMKVGTRVNGSSETSL